MEPATTTSMLISPMALQFSSMVDILQQRFPAERCSGNTALLVLVIPTTLAIMLDDAHGEPPALV